MCTLTFIEECDCTRYYYYLRYLGPGRLARFDGTEALKHDGIVLGFDSLSNKSLYAVPDCA
jgi:hypothetical protein